MKKKKTQLIGAQTKFNYEQTKKAFEQQIRYISEGTFIRNVIQDEQGMQEIISDIKIGVRGYRLSGSETDVCIENGEEILIVVQCLRQQKKITIKKVLSVEESFKVLCELFAIEIIGLSRLHEKLEHCYIYPSVLTIFLRSTGVVLIERQTFLSVAEITVFTVKPSDNEFTEMLLYVETNTNFVLLRPLKKKVPVEVALELFHIFCDYGTPHYVASSEPEFFNSALSILQSLSTPFKIPRFRGLSKNRKLRLMPQKVIAALQDWTKATKSHNWIIGAQVVQWFLNSSEVHDTYIRSKLVWGVIHSPHHALFNVMPYTELADFNVKYDGKVITSKNKKDDTIFILCGLCNQPVHSIYICDSCQGACHITCCQRFVEDKDGVRTLINKCLTCLDDVDDIIII